MKEVKLIKIDWLKTNRDVDELVPRMREQEWKDFLKSIERDGIRQPIDINKDMTIIDGRHRVDAAKLMGFEEIEARVHDLSEQELFKFVRDTAIERRHLTKEQRLHIVLSTSELIEELEYEALENKRKNLLKNQYQNSNCGPDEPQLKKVNTNAELGKIAGVSKSTVTRAKKVKAENPEAYDKVIKGESTFNREYEGLPSIKNKEYLKERNIEPKVSRPKTTEHVDLREKINEEAMSLEEIILQRPEMAAINIVDYAGHINDLLEEAGDIVAVERVISTLEVEKIIKLKNNIDQIVKLGGYKK
ncbi:ParB N-terminal domain-containing protein [Macrococcoides caseolyticum]|uniref:ParB N-terminal domain-containing protein n=1 Tax=Macrococcoides caseolyticum TaxID=69966 RepID=UPI000C32256F|nr:ParB N-terminal domain-containing protein [Macrococcus caseolyticus]PKE18697.1 hypothetical protein CW679_09840 [Macrococcus caseolyticus]PKF41653.1 hypothetical protein CW661_00525 [Macrococcus caseolyticus]